MECPNCGSEDVREYVEDEGRTIEFVCSICGETWGYTETDIEETEE